MSSPKNKRVNVILCVVPALWVCSSVFLGYSPHILAFQCGPGITEALLVYWVACLWGGAAAFILLVSSAFWLYPKHRPYWEHQLWAVLLLPAGMWLLLIVRIYACAENFFQQLHNLLSALLLFDEPVVSMIFYPTIVAAIIGIAGIRWSYLRHKKPYMSYDCG